MEELPKRKSLRLPKYDYSSCGLYFVTLCTHGRKLTLGSIRRGDPCGRPRWTPTVLGQIAAKDLAFIQNTFAITIDKFVIMPNHIHLLVFIPKRRATARVAPTQTQDNNSSYSLGEIIGGYKSKVSHDYLQFCKKRSTLMGELWQRGYYDHIIRCESDYLRIWQYMDENPVRWTEDEYYFE